MENRMDKNRNRSKWLLIAAILICTELFTVSVLKVDIFARAPKNTGDYGVFLNADSDDIKEMHGFSTVVIDAFENSAEDVALLHSKGCAVYSYINVGSIENWRSYYERYKHLAIGKYEHWEDEEWVNVSDKSWQDFVVNELAKTISDNGADGFFVDNADVYYKYPSDDIYYGLVNIMTGLKGYGKPVIINGGDNFVSRLIREEKSGIITGVNQESVFTRIKNYKKDRFGKQKKSDREYFQEYLAECKGAGLDVYLLEYTKSRRLVERIRKYCAENGFKYYVSDSLGLKWSEKALK
ncbi:hypothetical protein SAMN06296386_10433 [Lachnospiraceae bacterium]|nr:hypothetical protein SAMN06296386_10433 [Lachnospiraceae bacterium]